VGDLVSLRCRPAAAQRSASGGRGASNAVCREEDVVDELVRVDRQPRLLDRSVIGGAQPSHQIRVVLRLVGARDALDGYDSGFRQTEGEEVTGVEGLEPSLRAGPPEIVGVSGGIDALAAGQREVVDPPKGARSGGR